jgi:uroporphyrinogen-III synthase
MFSDLMDLINKHKEETFLVPLADIHKEEIPAALNDQKIKHTKAIIYRTVCSNLSDLVISDYDMLVFFSPSGIKSLKQNFPDFKQDGIKIASFGNTTAGAVEQAGLRLDVKAPMPEAPSMTMALDQFIKNHNKNCKK